MLKCLEADCGDYVIEYGQVHSTNYFIYGCLACVACSTGIGLGQTFLSDSIDAFDNVHYIIPVFCVFGVGAGLFAVGVSWVNHNLLSHLGDSVAQNAWSLTLVDTAEDMEDGQVQVQVGGGVGTILEGEDEEMGSKQGSNSIRSSSEDNDDDDDEEDSASESASASASASASLPLIRQLTMELLTKRMQARQYKHILFSAQPCCCHYDLIVPPCFSVKPEMLRNFQRTGSFSRPPPPPKLVSGNVEEGGAASVSDTSGNFDGEIALNSGEIAALEKKRAETGGLGLNVYRTLAEFRARSAVYNHEEFVYLEFVLERSGCICGFPPSKDATDAGNQPSSSDKNRNRSSLFGSQDATTNAIPTATHALGSDVGVVVVVVVVVLK